MICAICFHSQTNSSLPANLPAILRVGEVVSYLAFQGLVMGRMLDPGRKTKSRVWRPEGTLVGGLQTAISFERCALLIWTPGRLCGSGAHRLFRPRISLESGAHFIVRIGVTLKQHAWPKQ